MLTVSPLAVSELFPAAAPQRSSITASSLTVQPLVEKNEQETLAFLARRPLHTAVMSGLIRDNGLASTLNRGTFYACRDQVGQLEGVALFGHITLVEACTEAAFVALARRARVEAAEIHMIIGEQDAVALFWNCYASTGRAPRRICSELLFEQRFPIDGEACEAVANLRRATLDDLRQVMAIHAGLAFAETGVNPLDVDPAGFRARLLRRIEQNRVWVLSEGERLIFKADITAATPEVIYLEGIYVNPRERGKGWGLRCLSHLSRHLLARTESISLLVNEQNLRACGLYHKAGYKQRSRYLTIFV